MNRRQLIVLAAILVAVGFIAWLAWSSRQPPLLPSDETHARFEGAETCLSCHGAESAVPQSPGHPLGGDCLRCHGKR